MAFSITTQDYGRVQALADQGRTIDGWKLLASRGDHYAKVAVHVLSHEWSLLNCIRARHWELAAPGYPIGGKTWDAIANQALHNYLAYTKDNHDEHVRTTKMGHAKQNEMRLPHTEQIERSYMMAVNEVNRRHGADVSLKSIIHLAGNRLTTPVNKVVESAFHAVAPWAGPWKRALKRFTMPDWESTLSEEFGTLGSRQKHDSMNMAPDGYVHNAWTLARSFVGGFLRYREGQANLRPRQIVPGMRQSALGAD